MNVKTTSDGTIYNAWYTQRCERFHRSREAVIPEDMRSWHRRCPICEGHGEIPWGSYSYHNPPDYTECPLCEGLGRVNQDKWEQGHSWLRAQWEDEHLGSPYGRDDYDDVAWEPSSWR
jgi:hypothetical protein